MPRAVGLDRFGPIAERSSATWVAAGRRAIASPWAVVALVACGLALRVERWVHDRSLWGDEGALALNIIGKSAAQLTHRLEYLQGAPTGFLLVERLDVDLFGPTELSLRLFPLLCGIVALCVFAVVARRLLTPGGSLVALVLVSVAAPLVYYSSEVKQYSTDVAAASVLLLAAVSVEWRAVGRQGGFLLAVGGAAVVWFSHPALIVLPTLVAVLVAGAWLRDDRRALRALLPLTAIWAVSTVVAYVVNRANTSAVAHAALTGTPGVGGRLAPFKDAWHAWGNVIGTADSTTGLVVTAAVAGAVHLLRRDPLLVGLVLAPPAATFVAALLGLYPFTDRFVLFLAPFFAVLVGAGTVELARLIARVFPLAAAAAVLLVLVYPVGVAARDALSPPGHEEVRTVLRYVDARWRRGDALYVWWQSQFPLRYYAACRACGDLRPGGLRTVVWPPRLDETPTDVALVTHLPGLVVGTQLHELDGYVRSFRPLEGRRRVWFVFSSTWDDAGAQFVLGCLGRRLDEVHATRAAAYLYDLSARPDRANCSLPVAG